jgi:inorganic pyrophosphatase
MPTFNVIVETPKGSAQKYDLDPKTGYVTLKKIMPVGVVFPYDFGFIEGTIGEDGDPLDIIVISEIKLFPGCAVECRIIGAIKAVQQERDGEKMRNDRYIGIPVVSIAYADVNALNQLPRKTIQEIENFFSNYNTQAGKKFDPLARVSAKSASAMLQKAKNKNVIKSKLIQIFLPLSDKKTTTLPPTIF